jgi:aldose 1-epimerase
MKVLREEFAKKDDQSISCYTIVNDSGLEISCINYGCIITMILAPDRVGKFENVVLGYDSLEDYEKGTAYFGAVIGRVAGRIKGASFDLDGETFRLPKNSNGNSLHGGSKSFDKVIWDGAPFESEKEAGVKFTYTSADGEEGYPGEVALTVTYTLNNENEFIISYNGKATKKTILTMTNHSYFNLSGDGKEDILRHSLTLKSDAFLELDEELMPTGTLLDVEGTHFDFRNGRLIQTGANSDHPQNVLAGNGYDHPFLLKSNHDEEIVLKDGNSGRTLTIETDEPAVVVYSGTQLSPDVQSNKYMGICLETQGVPDAIHHPQFPSIVLDKDQEYSTSTKYRFGVSAS